MDKKEIANLVFNKLIDRYLENKYEKWLTMASWKYHISHILYEFKLDAKNERACDEYYIRAIFDILYKVERKFVRTDTPPFQYAID
tara:strand:+ start:3834 stop:4091 length:258 start_codon:yes stop_codon:yes gene_type:complete